MRKEIRLYNVLFPVWMLMTLPVIWWIVIPGNFIIDSLVLVIAMKALKLENRWEFYRMHIIQVFLLGFLADVLASVPMWLGVFLELGGPLADSPVLTVPGVLLAGVLIYVFDYCISFRKLDKNLRKKLALTFAIVTAPYTYLIPSRWIYGF